MTSTREPQARAGSSARRPRRVANATLPHRSPLARHLAAVLVAKALLLALLWVAFVRDARVHVDPAAMAERASLAATAAPASQGEHRE